MTDWDADGEPIPVQVASRPRAAGDRRPAARGRRERDGSDASTGTRDDPDLHVLVTDLERTLRDLRGVLERDADSVRERDGSSLPRPPSPRVLLRFTEEYTIPATVATLEAAVRGLELLGGAIRLLDGRDPRRSEERRGGRDAADVLADASAVAGERAAAGGRQALSQVDEALTHLQRTYEGEPADPAARRLLADARQLRADIDDRLGSIERASAERAAAPQPDREAGEPERGPQVDVDAELESLKERAGRGDDDRTDGPTVGDPDDVTGN
jgi:hypothetical protein